MRFLIIFFFLLFTGTTSAQQKIENIIVITTDGLRWQEVFMGMDSSIANMKKFNQGDSAYIYKSYWHPDVKERRTRLMPFIWGNIEKTGRIYGNRTLNNNVNNANPYWFSYPGYSEIFTGYPDTAINSNNFKPNPHVTVLEYLNKQSRYHGRMAAFGAWEAFDRILNEERAGFPVQSSFDTVKGKLNEKQKLINTMLSNSYRPFGSAECLDVFTHYAAMEYLKANKPRILYVAYGETDEWAHHGYYRSYLDAAKQVDAWIREFWDHIQRDPQYRDRTALLITTDHGRGDLNKEQWTDHGQKVSDASEIWFAILSPSIQAKGEMANRAQYFQKQFAQTIAMLLGEIYTANHPIAEAIDLK